MDLVSEKYFKNGVLLLVKAAMNNNPVIVKNLIAEGVNVNIIGLEGMTPLIFAVLKQDSTAIRLLIENGADPLLMIPNTGNAVSIACQVDQILSLQTLINLGVDIKTLVNKAPLTFTAALADNIPAIELLTNSGISIDARDGAGSTLLIESLIVNDLDLAEWIVHKGGNVHVINIFFVSAAYKLQSRLKEAEGKGPNVPQYQKLITLFEKRGVAFPVPTPIELKKTYNKNSISIEDAANLNERGVLVDKSKN